jgi:hypothetical protein
LENFVMSLVRAHELIGEFFCAFSKLDRAVGETLKIVLRLKGNPAADAIVGVIGDFVKKTNIVKEAVQTAKRADGTEPDPVWKADADKTLDKILGCNNPDRIDLAHSYLEPHSDGSVSLQRPGRDPSPWTSEDFQRRIANMNELASKLEAIRTDLTVLNIPVPTGWMSMDTYQPRPRVAPFALQGTGSSLFETPPPLPQRDGHD